MSRNGFGTFAILNPILIGALRASASVNADYTDMGTAITGTLPLDATAGMSGQFKAADGSKSTPGIAFAADTNTGFRRNGTDEMRWVAGGTDRMYVDANGKAWHLSDADIAGALVCHGALTGTISDPLLIAQFAANGVARRTATTPTWAPEPFYYTLHMTIGGFGLVLPTGVMGEMQAPCAGTIVAGALMLDQSGSVSVDVRKCTYANYSATRPSSSDSITAASPLAVTSGVGLLDQTLAGWTTPVAADDCFRFYISSVTTVTRMTVALRIKRFA